MPYVYDDRSETTTTSKFLLPEGEYDFTVLEATFCQSKKGNDQIKLKLSASEQSVYVYEYLQLSGKYVWRTDQFLGACGLLPQKGQSLPLDNQDWLNANVVGAKGQVKLRQEDHEGKLKNKVDCFLARAVEPAPVADLALDPDVIPAPLDNKPVNTFRQAPKLPVKPKMYAPSTYEKAWEACVSVLPEQAPEDAVMKDWERALGQLFPSKDPATFTAADWGKVIAEGPTLMLVQGIETESIPF